jgi:hypothetical protein
VPTDAALSAMLAARPRAPADPGLFSSNPVFGEPGISPQGSPMTPATGRAPTEADAVGALSGFMIRVRTAPATLSRGSAAMVVGMVALAIIGPDGPLRSVLLTLAVTGFGNGIVYSPATSYALVDIQPDDAAEALAVLSALRVLGLVLAVALSTSLTSTIDDALPGGSWGLPVSLLLAALITAVGWVLARRAPVPVAERK